MKKFKKIYVEISNICNLNCSFCPKTTRKTQSMTSEQFKYIANKIRKHSDYIYLHVKGEPTLHKELEEILKICEELDFKVCITTNGTLLKEKEEILLKSKAVHKLHISLHSFEASDIKLTFDEYLNNIINIIKKANFIIVLRLWNQGGDHKLNQDFLNLLKNNFDFISENKITDKCFLQYGEKFQWANLKSKTQNQTGFCYGLRDQIGILVDGTVVPCCLDNNGDINLGNIYQNTIEEIYNSPRAKELYNNFSNRKFSEKLCQSCGFIKTSFLT